MRSRARTFVTRARRLIESEDVGAAEQALDGRGRLVIRPSGTEPVIRVMAEGDDRAEVEQVVDSICDAVRAAAG